jgi:hypothetical protein
MVLHIRHYSNRKLEMPLGDSTFDKTVIGNVQQCLLVKMRGVWLARVRQLLHVRSTTQMYSVIGLEQGRY